MIKTQGENEMKRKEWKAVDRFLRNLFMCPMSDLEKFANEDAASYRAVAAYKNLISDITGG